MFRRVLIANRGEIAQRVIRACRELGIETVAVYSAADADALYLRQADETICIGPAQSAKSYLDIPSIIAAAEVADVDAIHPGYGFLAENDHFAEVCRSCKIQFIGPDARGDRGTGRQGPGARARACGRGAGRARLRRRSRGREARPRRRAADRLPDHDQGRGRRRRARDAHRAQRALAGGELPRRPAPRPRRPSATAPSTSRSSSRTRATSRCRSWPTSTARSLHLGERDCSIQRRHQKLIEESPSPALTPELREQICAAALRVARAANYTNAGTVEFLLARDGSFYFIEVNARIQVEHTVTELVTGLDLIQQQILIASGEPLAFGQQDVKFNGHAHRVPHQRRGPGARLPALARPDRRSSCPRAARACASTATATVATGFRRTTTR